MTLSVEDIQALAREIVRLSDDELLADVDVAALLKLGKSTVWLYAQTGLLPRPVKIGNNTRWFKSDVLASMHVLKVAA